jgi:hypothetical protein
MEGTLKIKDDKKNLLTAEAGGQKCIAERSLCMFNNLKKRKPKEFTKGKKLYESIIVESLSSDPEFGWKRFKCHSCLSPLS